MCKVRHLLLVVMVAAIIPSPTFSQSSSLKSITKPDFPCGEPYGPNGEPPARRRRVARQIIFPDDKNYHHYWGLLMRGGNPVPRDNPPPAQAIGEERFCSASPISDHFLVTAAHCVYDPDRPVSAIRLGDIDLTSETETNSRPADYEIDLILAHPDYDPDSKVRYNDVALLRTTKPIQFNDVVFPYCVSDTPPAPGTIVTASGFGLYNATTQPNHLLEANFTVVHQSECEDTYVREGVDVSLRVRYPHLLRESDILCAIDDVSDACQGDSGGPMFLKRNGKQYLEGIVSGGASCRGNFKSVLPGLYLSLAYHVDFINANVFQPLDPVTP